ncbi:MAG TPA: cyclic nucleotide-binding domain-containing protein [Spirochaetia bacterium]|nr:cyclic nucleotide-binding domain-containing protein [Spirochaetales bacterium]HRY73862.1 cyclic nucleotide-binding domain-containing protein [Spirochaetia bacterium]
MAQELDYFEFLRRVYFFKDLADDEIRLVEGSCAEEEYAAGDVLFVEGSTADRFYIVIEGRVEVWKNFYDPKPDLLAVHGPGHFFGEMALVDELPRSATVVAKDPVRVLYLYRDDFRRLIKERSSIALSVMTSISFMVRSSNEVFVDDLRRRNAELERAYADLEKAQAERLRTERLSTLGKFSSLILHDIRNPLSILKGQLQLMEIQADEAPEKARARIKASLAEVARLERLASEFLDYSRGEIRLDMAIARPSSLLFRIEEGLRDRLAERGIACELDAAYDEPVILDEERVARALHNVADNARKAMAAKGGVLRMGSRREGDLLVFEVADSGEGMSPEVLSRVFEPFYSSSGQGGTGLGMLIVKNIVEAHGGSVSLQSAPGEGTRVSLSFPLRA